MKPLDGQKLNEIEHNQLTVIEDNQLIKKLYVTSSRTMVKRRSGGIIVNGTVFVPIQLECKILYIVYSLNI